MVSNSGKVEPGNISGLLRFLEDKRIEPGNLLRALPIVEMPGNAPTEPNKASIVEHGYSGSPKTVFVTKNVHIGSSLDVLLEEEGLLEEASREAIRRVGEFIQRRLIAHG